MLLGEELRFNPLYESSAARVAPVQAAVMRGKRRLAIRPMSRVEGRITHRFQDLTTKAQPMMFESVRAVNSEDTHLEHCYDCIAMWSSTQLAL